MQQDAAAGGTQRNFHAQAHREGFRLLLESSLMRNILLEQF